MPMPGIAMPPLMLARRHAFEAVYLQGTATATSGTTTRTYAGQNLGAADLDRYIVVGVGGERAGATTVNSVTVAGVTATKVAAADNSGNDYATLWIAHVPAGVSGDVVVTFSADPLVAGIALWALYSPGSLVDTGSGTSSADVDVLPGDIIIAMAENGSGSANTWTNATVRYNETVGGCRVTGADHVSAATETRTISGSVLNKIVLAAWRG